MPAPLLGRLRSVLWPADAVFPRRCAGCGAAHALDARALCPDCARALARVEGGYCPACGEAVGADDEPPTVCGACRTSPEPWNRLFFHSRYAGRPREMVLTFKFSGGLHLTRLLRDLVFAALPKDGTWDLVAPVPLHPTRLLWRGFNQSLELARGPANRLGVPVRTGAIHRVRATVPQTKLSGDERRANLAGAFAAEHRLVAKRRVLLVDDVATTGSTLRECARTLLGAGAESVDCLVFARSLGTG